MLNGLRTTILLAMTLVAAWCAPTQAGTFQELLAPPVSRKDYVSISALLALQGDQRAAADLVFEGYLASYDREADRLRELYQKLQIASEKKSDDMRALKLAFDAAFDRFWRRKDFAQFELLADLKFLLTDDQIAARWESVERFVRRKLLPRTAPRTASSWHLVNVTELVEALELPAESKGAVTDRLHEYEIAVDKPLLRFQSLLWSKSGTWLEPSEADLARAAEEVGREVAFVNRKYTRWMIELLPSHERALWEGSRARAYWSYATIAGQRAQLADTFSRAAQLPDLDEVKRHRLNAIQREWEQRVESLFKEMVDQYDLADDEIQAMSDERWSACVGTESNPIVKVRNAIFARTDEAAKLANQGIAGLLTPAQQRSLGR